MPSENMRYLAARKCLVAPVDFQKLKERLSLLARECLAVIFLSSKRQIVDELPAGKESRP